MLEEGDYLVVFGFTTSEFVRRVAGSIGYVVLDLVFWLIIPVLLLSRIGQVSSFQIPLLAAPIIILSAVSHIFTRNPIGYTAGAGASIASTFFLLFVTNAGSLTTSIPIPSSPLQLVVTLRFPTLLYLLIVPLAVTIARNVWAAVHVSSTAEVSLEETREI